MNLYVSIVSLYREASCSKVSLISFIFKMRYVGRRLLKHHSLLTWTGIIWIWLTIWMSFTARPLPAASFILRWSILQKFPSSSSMKNPSDQLRPWSLSHITARGPRNLYIWYNARYKFSLSPTVCSINLEARIFTWKKPSRPFPMQNCL